MLKSNLEEELTHRGKENQNFLILLQCQECCLPPNRRYRAKEFWDFVTKGPNLEPYIFDTYTCSEVQSEKGLVKMLRGFWPRWKHM